MGMGGNEVRSPGIRKFAPPPPADRDHPPPCPHLFSARDLALLPPNCT